jgi:predicted nucleic acid-binding protein
MILLHTSILIDYIRKKDPKLSTLLTAALGVHLNIEVWTRDKQFQLIQTAVPQMLLYQEPP